MSKLNAEGGGIFANPIRAMLDSEHSDGITFVCADPNDNRRARNAALMLRHRCGYDIRTTAIYPEGMTIYKDGVDKWDLMRQIVRIEDRSEKKG